MTRGRTRFALDRRVAIALVAALLAIELLGFAAGFLLGVQMPATVAVVTPATKQATRPTPPRPAAPVQALAMTPLSLPFATFPRMLDVSFFSWPRKPKRTKSPYETLLRDAALRHGLSPQLVIAVARVESDLDPHVVSHKGALGLMQVMPATGARFGVKKREELFQPHRNAAAGTAYLAWLLRRYENDLDLALAAYNAGEGAVDKYGGIPPYAETREYVRRVRAHLRASFHQ